ncbi:MAG: UbiA-like polyprenyltransferase [Phycisphaerae bacterium]
MPGIAYSVRTWSEMIKVSHSVFALPFALIATFLAGRELEGLHRPHAGQLVLIVVCMVAGRSVAMTFNRIVDKEIDAGNPRTAGRPLPAGKLKVRAAYGFLLASAVVFVTACYGFLCFYANRWPILLAGPVLLYLCGYSYTKRFTRWSHFYLGSAIGLSPLAAWLAIHPGSIGVPVVVLSVGVMLWIAGFDIIYACQDVDCDQEQGLFSLPSRVGVGPALWTARLCHLTVVVCLVVLGMTAPLGWLYFVGVVVVAVLLGLENSLVRPNDLSKVNVAFFTVNGLVSVGLGLLAILDIFLVTPGAGLHQAG